METWRRCRRRMREVRVGPRVRPRVEDQGDGFCGVWGCGDEG